jgi:LemA protein
MIYIMAIVVLIAILLIVFIAINNNYNILLIKINEAFINCTGSLGKKKDIIIEILNSFNNKEKEEANKISSYLDSHDDIFDLYTRLEKAYFDINQILEAHPSYDDNKKINELLINLSDIEEELEADNNYYNDNVTIYNNLINSLPSNLIAFIKRYKIKRKFEKTKMEKYEILKEEK